MPFAQLIGTESCRNEPFFFFLLFVDVIQKKKGEKEKKVLDTNA